MGLVALFSDQKHPDSMLPFASSPCIPCFPPFQPSPPSRVLAGSDPRHVRMCLIGGARSVQFFLLQIFVQFF